MASFHTLAEAAPSSPKASASSSSSTFLVSVSVAESAFPSDPDATNCGGTINRSGHSCISPCSPNGGSGGVAVHWHDGDLESVKVASSLSAASAPPAASGGDSHSRVGFYAFLIVFYIGSKGLSQLFASYVASQEHMSAPIYLSTCEYLMWVILGAIHNFTIDLESTWVPPSKGVETLTNVDKEMPQVHSAAAATGSSSSSSSAAAAASSSSSASPSDVELALMSPGAADSASAALLDGHQEEPSTGGLQLTQRHAVQAAAAGSGSGSGSVPGHQCQCACPCAKCRHVAEVYPSRRITVLYLCGELVKTVLEVIAVSGVELSLALVLLATAPLFSILFRFVVEHKYPTAKEGYIVLLVSIGLAMRIPEISSAPFAAVAAGLVSAASAAWISSFKSLIFDPPTAPHVLSYMYRFGPVLFSACLVLCVSTEMSALKVAFRNTDESIETLAFGMMFALLAAPSSVVSKRLQKLLGSFQRTLLGVINNVVVALVSLVIISSTKPSALAVIGSLFVFLSPAVHYVEPRKVNKCITGIVICGRRVLFN